MGRKTDFIETGRAQLYVDVTTHARPGEGKIELSGGSSGSVDGILVAGTTQLLGSAVAYNSSLATTAEDVARAINKRITVPNYHARSVGVFIYIWQQTIVAGTITLVATTTTITTNDTDIGAVVADEGVVGNGTAVGYTEEGFALTYNDEYLKEPTEESGTSIRKTFFIGGDPTIDAIFKQWDENVLALRHRGKHTTGAANSNVNRIEIPGIVAPGGDMESYFQVMELRPDNLKYPTLLIRRGQVFGDAGEPTRFRTQETKKVGVTIDCQEDTSAPTAYRTLGIDLAQNLSLS